MRRCGFATLCVWLLATTVAHAQSVVVLVPPALASGVNADEGERAVGAITKQLRTEGYNIISPGQAASAMAALGGEEGLPGGASAHECSSEACAVAFREFFESEVAARVELRRVSGAAGEGASSLQVTLVAGARKAWEGQAGIAKGDVEAAAQRALAAARTRRAGREPMLSVEGTPEGARVAVDGRAVGVLPYQGGIKPGRHEVEVRSPGMAAESRTIEVGRDPGKQTRVEMSLVEAPAVATPEQVAASSVSSDEAQDQAASASAGDREGTAVYDWIVGGGLVAAGAVLGVIIPATSAAKSGQCTNGDSDVTQCPEVYDVDGAVWGQVVVGAVLMGAGAAVMWKKPIQLMLGADRQGASVSLRGRF